MRRSLLTLFTVASIAALAATSAATALGASTVTLKLKVKGSAASGGSVLAISSKGRAVRAKIGSGTISLKVPKATLSGTTLQLIGKKGSFLGPVVLGSASGGKKAYLTLGKGAGAKRSLNLGKATVKKGYASLAKPLAVKSLLTSAYASATKGAPTGAGRLGLQKPSTNASAAQDGGGGGGQIPSGTDPDHDGLTSNFDVDDNGNGILDNQDATQAPTGDGVSASMSLGPSDNGVNVNAGGVTAAQIDANVSGENRFQMGFIFPTPAGGPFTGAYVDCGALPYCNSATGTAVMTGMGGPSTPLGSLWRSWRPNGNPQGNGLDQSSGGFAIGLQPRATTAQLAPGDLFNVVFRASAGDVTTPVALASYPVTVPAVKTVTTGGTTTTIDYGNPSGPGANNSTAIQVGADGGVELEYWRPQRRGIAGAGEPAMIDMGHLRYTMSIGGLAVGSNQVQASLGFSCDAAGNAVPADSDDFLGLADSADDSPPSATNTRSYTTNLRTCLGQAITAGYFPPGTSLTGATVFPAFEATGVIRRGMGDRATLLIAFRF